MMAGQIGGGTNGGSTIIVNGVEKDTTEVYNEVKDGLKDVLAIERPTPPIFADDMTFEEREEAAIRYEEERQQYMQQMTESLDSTLRDNGIELEDELVSGIADYIDDNVDDKNEYSDDELNEIILSYYDVYLEYLENGGSAD